LALAGLFLSYWSEESRIHQSLSQAGVIKSQTNDVRRKASSELAWNRVREGAPVFNEDRVFTGDNSTASIELGNGVTLSVNPNSIVVISLPEKERIGEPAAFELWSFLSRLKRGQPYLLRPKGKTSPTENQVGPKVEGSAYDTRVKVQVLSGSVEVQTHETQTTRLLTLNQEAEISGHKLGITPERTPSSSSLEEAEDQAPAVVFSQNEITARPVPFVSFPTEVNEPIASPPPNETSAPLQHAKRTANPESQTKPQVAIGVPNAQPIEQLAFLGEPIENSIAPVPTREFDTRIWLWIGLGANYQFYQQTVKSLGAARFQTLQGPTRLARGGFMADEFGIDLSYKETPGKMNSSSTVSIRQGHYVWQTLTGEFLVKPNGKKSSWNLRSGVQHHTIPFIVQNPFSTEIELLNNSVTTLTLGFDRNFTISDRFLIEWQLRYQYPLLSTAGVFSEFNVHPHLSFDGSIGGVIPISRSFRAGIFWYGQLHKFAFDFAPASSLEFSGQQTLFYSNVELRIGLEF
jgi:hypothetical protein